MSTPPAPVSRTSLAALAVLGLCLLLNLVGRGMADTYVVFLLPLERDLGWSRSQMTSVYSIYLVVNGLTAPLVGMMFDRLGPRVIYTAGLVCLGGAFWLASRIEAMWQFYATIGAMSGFAVAAVGMVPSSSILARWFRERLSTAISVGFAGLGLGALLIVPAAQTLLQTAGWRESYALMGQFALALAIPVCLLPWRRIAAGRQDYVVPARRAGTASEGPTLAQAMRSRTFWGLAWVFSMTSVGMYSVTVQVVAFLVEQGFAPLLAATVYGSASMLSVFGIVATGMIADRFGPRWTVMATYCGSIAGILILLVVSWHPDARWLVAFVIVFGLCQGARGPIVSAMTTRLFAGAQVATIYGVIYASNALGAGLGALIGGVMHDITASYRPGMVFSVGCLVMAGLPFWRIPAMRHYRAAH